MSLHWLVMLRQTNYTRQQYIDALTSVKRKFYIILKNHNKQEQNQDNIVERQAYRLIINDVHKYIFNGSKLSKVWSYIHIFREKSIKVPVNALNLFIVLCLYHEHDCKF